MSYRRANQIALILSFALPFLAMVVVMLQVPRWREERAMREAIDAELALRNKVRDRAMSLVKHQVISPATAVIDPTTTDLHEIPHEDASAIRCFVVSGTIDAENYFGAKIRQRWLWIGTHASGDIETCRFYLGDRSANLAELPKGVAERLDLRQ